MNRRAFLRDTSLASAGILTASAVTPFQPPPGKTHVLTLSFDDGFKKSFHRIAKMHEDYGLKACLNVIATGHLPRFRAPDKWILPKLLGNFDDWNLLTGRGHEVMPHSWEHLDLTETPLSQAKENILKCLEYFEDNLDGYDPSTAVYNYAFDASTPELDAFTLQHVRAVRTGGWLLPGRAAYNNLPAHERTGRLGCWTKGPYLNDLWVHEEINFFLEKPGGWLILNLHGLDKEGWGPLSKGFLDSLLKRLVEVDYLAIMPTGQALATAA